MSMRHDALKAANERDYRLSDGLQPLYLEEMLARLCDWADRQDAPKAEPETERSSPDVARDIRVLEAFASLFGYDEVVNLRAKVDEHIENLRVLACRSGFDEEKNFNALAEAVREYVISKGGRVYVVGPVSIEQGVGGRVFNHRLVVHFTGMLPQELADFRPPTDKEGG